jgi:hypothetical protein
MLFLFALVVLYPLRDWKKVVILATAFTVGHSLTLAIATMGLFSINPRIVEILIAVSIFLTAADNFVYEGGSTKIRYRYLSALIFGLVHGMGFSNSLRSIMIDDNVVVPLLAFNIGVELGQIGIVLCALCIGWVVVDLIRIKRKYYVFGVSFLIMLWSLKLIVERF